MCVQNIWFPLLLLVHEDGEQLSFPWHVCCALSVSHPPRMRIKCRALILRHCLYQRGHQGPDDSQDKWSASRLCHWLFPFVRWHWCLFSWHEGVPGAPLTITCAGNYQEQGMERAFLLCLQRMTASEIQAGSALRQISQESLRLPSFDSSSSVSIAATLIITEGCRSSSRGIDSDTASV